MVSMSDELSERNILKLILMVRVACATLAVGHPIGCPFYSYPSYDKVASGDRGIDQ
jgi:hypothetical protein